MKSPMYIVPVLVVRSVEIQANYRSRYSYVCPSASCSVVTQESLEYAIPVFDHFFMQ
jgi:hypothetical protein